MEQRKKATYSLPTSLIERLKELSKERQINMSILLQLALEDYLRKEGKGEKA